MEPLDKNYLSLQFWNKIHEKTGTEFQSFFENIMEKAYPHFQKIRPYGNEGDGGNDGYRPDEGIYYQVYAPQNPQEKEATAAQKLKDDFQKLMKSGWDQISNVKAYNFVYNDKKCGVTMKIEEALAELKKDNSTIQFGKLLSTDLETIFFTLNKEQLLALGFNVDSTKAVSLAREYLKKLETDLDRENAEFVQKALTNLKDIIEALQDEGLGLDFEILECRTLQKLEKRIEAKDKYQNICTRYPNDPRAFLYLAEIYIDDGNFEENESLLEKAGKINDSYWLFKLEKLIRELRLGNKIDPKSIDENTFPSEPTIKSHFYRVYSFFVEQSGDQEKTDSFIERAIKLNPDKFNNYNAKLSILIGRVHGQKDREALMNEASKILPEFDAIEEKIAEWGNLNTRNRAMLNVKKMHLFHILENVRELEQVAPKTFELLLECYFDSVIDEALVELLLPISLPENDLKRLLKYLQEADNKFSDSLAKMVIIQFLHKSTLLTEGKNFFEEVKKEKALEFIDNLQNKKYDEAWEYLKDDLRFAVAVANSAKDFPDLRKKIIENLPGDGSIQKEKLLLLLNYDQQNIDEAFELLKGFDLSNLSYFECRPILEIAQQKKAWDFVVKILEQLLNHEKDEKIALQLKLQLFTANLNLGKFPEVIRIGEGIIANAKEINLLDDQNKEIVLGQTLWVRMKRSEYAEAKELLEKYQNFSKTFEFKIGVEAEVYLKNKEAEKALDSVVSGIQILKTPTPEEYGRLFIFFTELGNLIDFPLVASDKVEVNCFVKFKDQERWYFIGDEEELDATKILTDNERHSLFLDKKVGDKVVFENKYSSREEEHTIENILPIEKYILWQCMHHAQELSMQKRWGMMEMIEVPTTGDTIDPQYLIARMEDIKKSRGDFFDLYCKENLPLAFLALNQGGLTEAFGCIINENKGFIKFSSGDLAEINQQKEVAKKMINGNPFYLDGTSALVLSETGNLERVRKHLPNLKVPQSVITLLLELKEKFRYSSGQTGHLGYAQGQLRFSSIDQEKRDRLQENFAKSISLLEENPDNIEAISNASKMDCFSEQKIPAELCDACILAQKEEAIVLTEDFLYLKANELETKKNAPDYCSTFALMRVLYEDNKITFDDYLAYFAYLSSYRFRFLPINTDDISKAVFGDGAITTIAPEKIKQLNFPLTLSEEYGVPFDTAFLVVGKFVIRILVDDAILPEFAERIFIEVLENFPTDKDKRSLGQMFIRVSVQAINKMNQRFTVGTETQEKVDRLIQVAELYRNKKFLID